MISSIVADADVTMNNEYGFMTALPSDIVFMVFSYLSQEDCLRCMSVCRAWDNTIPQYTQQVWTQLYLDGNDVYKTHRRRERCLGTHVKHVMLDSWNFSHPGKHATPEPTEEVQMRHLMQRLMDWGCTQIESLDIRMGIITDLDAFGDALSKLAPHLTNLTMTNSHSAYLLPRVLNACPELTHFEDRQNTGGFRRQSLAGIPIENDTKIKFLRLDYPMDKNQLKCILKKSPDLRCFIAEHQLNRLSSSDTFDLDSLFSWCPKISYLSTTRNVRPSNYAYAYINGHAGLRYLSITDCYKADQIARCLTRGQNTLEYLSISKHSNQPDDDLSRVFRSTQLSKLQTLVIHDIHLNAESFVTLLNHCPSLMELYFVLPRLTLDLTAIQLLGPMDNLRTLDIYAAVLDDELSLLTILERLPALEVLNVSKTCLPVTISGRLKYQSQLKHLKLSEVTWKHNQETDKDGGVANFLKHLAQNSSLESICIYEGQALGHKSLRALATIPTLKSLTLPIDNKAMQNDEAVESIRAFGSTAIETLELSEFNDLSFSILDALAQLPLLTKFSSSKRRMPSPENFQRVSKKGLQQLLCKSPNLAAVSFQHAIFEDDGVSLTRSQVEKFMRLYIPQYKGYGLGRWEVRILNILDVNGKDGQERENFSVRQVEVRRIVSC